MEVTIVYKKDAFLNMNYEQIAKYLISLSIEKDNNQCLSYISLKNIAFQDCIICYN